jgi:hypothetical protein
MVDIADLFPKSGGGVGASGVALRRFFLASGTYTAPEDQEVIIHAIGGGGSGGIGFYYTGCQPSATGGGAGGYSRRKASLSGGDALTITVGAGGAVVHGSGPANTASADNGLDGGDTTVTGPGVSITAGGGAGGVASLLQTSPLNGGAGGVATGGDVNYEGGRRGNLAALGSLATGTYRITGGGAVNLWGLDDCNGGDITITTSANNRRVATAGGSIWGSGEDITSDTNYGSNPALWDGFIPPNHNVSTAFTLPDLLIGVFPTIGPLAKGYTTSAYNTTPYTGGTGGGTGGMSTAGGISGITAGAFGGGGGVISSQYDFDASGSNGGYGGGGGGTFSAGYYNSATLANRGNSGKGGDGIVVIEVMK